MVGGGVANGGHLLGLIAFARKIARVLLSLSLLCGILLLSVYLGSHSNDGADVNPYSITSTNDDGSLVMTSIIISNSAPIAAFSQNNPHPAESNPI
ncbi:GH14690 [Drosophila grimshawi]|uniref:GH14690 n=2 Tax=Drosophila grimshawi TaxID=7222 RepID=B4IXC9_DROGR|nr:GH14690 [Drosophila grimshawi]